MSEELEEAVTEVEPSELDALKQRAALMGIKHHPTIGLEKLRAKVNAKISEDTPVNELPESQIISNKEKFIKRRTETLVQKKARLRKEALTLHRVTVTCLDPSKKAYPGEYISAGNAYTGEVKKFVEYNSEDGFHLPLILINALKEKEFTHHFSQEIKGAEQGRNKQAKAYIVTMMNPLTQSEIEVIAKRQAMANNLDNLD